MVKKVNPAAKVFVYRNLVKALPWYTSVREKIVDPAYSGWFLRFKEGGTNGTGVWNVPRCTKGTNPAAVEKCSDLYHDQEQTPKAPPGGGPTRVQDGKWWIYNNTNDVSGMHPGWHSITSAGPQPSWEACRDAADAAGRKIFTFWCPGAHPLPYTCPVGSDGTCWLSSDWNTPKVQDPNQTAPNAESGHVSGYRPSGTPGTTDSPPASLAGAALCASGDCDCGDGLPCGEYLWDHRNESLREWLVNEFILGKETGLGNPNVDGFFLDDGWRNTTAPVPSWAKASYR
eukprot:gene15195-18755_t